MTLFLVCLCHQYAPDNVVLTVCFAKQLEMRSLFAYGAKKNRITFCKKKIKPIEIPSCSLFFFSPFINKR